jgi:two-component system chemotaxis response regulator CheB
MTRTRVLVIDDSALVRSLLTEIINRQPDMVTVGAARDPLQAREMIRATDPDVLTLDIEMPRMDGLDFLERLMRLRPTPVVMVSTMTERGAEVTLRALELGAVDFVAKPKLDLAVGLREAGADLCDKIRIASKARMRRVAAPPATDPEAVTPVARKTPVAGLSTEKLIAIGSSTGGTEAIREVLTRLPPDAPGVLIAQHMPPGFTRSFAQRLDGLCRIAVSEAVDGERVRSGHAYIAPGDRHLTLVRSGADYVIALDDGPAVNHHRPSVDVLFASVARHAGVNACGVMLTGMGKDGARGMLAMKQAGAVNLAQDEASCIVFGMPREAVAVGAVDEVLPLSRIAARLVELVAVRGSPGLRI